MCAGMTDKQPGPGSIIRLIGERLLGILKNNWKLKALSLLVSLVVWGALISEDASLTREKTFVDVPVTITGVETLQRNGYIVTSGLDELEPIRMRAEVPQKVYEGATPASYSVRVDVSRISGVGTQTLPIQTSTSITYGAVSWLSQNEITVEVEEYITRRRIPVRLQLTGSLPAGFYSSGASVDPGTVVVSGPRSLVERIVQVLATHNQSAITVNYGAIFSVVPFVLMDAQGNEVSSKLISVTSENVLLDTLLVEQVIYPMKAVDINLTGLLKGQPEEGYRIAGILADPDTLWVAAPQERLEKISLLDLSGSVDVTGLRDSLIRAVRVEKPAGSVYLSDNAVYVNIEIVPMEAPVPDENNQEEKPLP